MKGGNSLVKKIGISKCEEERLEYFSQFNVREIIKVPDHLPDIEEIVSVLVEPKIISLKAIKTMRGVSAEGQYLSGGKLLAEIEISEKILYLANIPDQSLHVIENKSFHSGYIVIPPLIEGTKIDLLIRYNRLKAKVFTEDIAIKLTNCREIFKNIFLLLGAKFKPSYEICFSEHYDCKKSDISISYDDGRFSKKIICDNDSNNKDVSWSPTGQEIAYLSNIDDTYMLYVTDINYNNQDRITDSKKFDCITSYCWNNRGDKIFFTGVVNGKKDIYLADIKKQTTQQITYGDGYIKSFRPKSSYDGKKIAFIRSGCNVSDLYLIEPDGLKLQRITDGGFIKDFSWSIDNKHIVYISEKGLGKSCLCIIDICTLTKVFVKIPRDIMYLRKVKYSPRGRYITYIVKDFSTDNIYLYDIDLKRYKNITKNTSNITISDYTWKVNEEKIYYCANDLGYFNIYSLDIKREEVIQITNSTSINMKLSYRPRII